MDRTPYVAALRLYAVAEERWAEIEAHYVAVDLLRLPSAKFLNCVYAWAVRYMDAEAREKWEMLLTAPLPGAEKKKPSESEVEAEGAAFLAAMGQHRALTGKG